MNFISRHGIIIAYPHKTIASNHFNKLITFDLLISNSTEVLSILLNGFDNIQVALIVSSSYNVD